MKFISNVVFVVCSIVISGAFSDVTYEEEDDVIILNSENFDRAIAEFKHILVEFYAPWCGHCKTLAPEYSKAAKLLKEQSSPIRMAKVDATVETELAEKYEVRGYPTVKLFRDGSIKNYEQPDLDPEKIVAWLKKKTGSPVEVIENLVAFRTALNHWNAVVMGFFKDNSSQVVKDFIQVADDYDDLHFAITDQLVIFAKYNVTQDNCVAIFRQSDDGRVDLTENLTVEGIKDFLELHSLPPVVEFASDTAAKIFEKKLRKHLILFISKDDEKFDRMMAAFKEAAKRQFGKVIFIFLDVGDDTHERVLQWFHVTPEECPTTRLVDLDGLIKYRPDTDDWTADQLVQFIQDVLDRTRRPYYMSQELPEDWYSQPVKVLVSNKFEEIAMDQTKTVFVMFYAPWCGFCKELAPIWEELGEKYKDRSDVLIGKMDATANEVEGNKVSIFPTLKLIPKNSNEVIDFPGSVDKTLERLIEFVESEGHLKELELQPEESPSSQETKETTKAKESTESGHTKEEL